MRIGELANITGTTTKTLRFYEDAGLLAPPQRTDSGYRDYDESAVNSIGFIKAGQAVGLTLAHVRQLLTLRHDGRPPCAAATQLLDARLADITRKIEELQQLRQDLLQLRSLADTLDPTTCDPDSICHIINPETCRCGQHGSQPTKPVKANHRA